MMAKPKSERDEGPQDELWQAISQRDASALRLHRQALRQTLARRHLLDFILYTLPGFKTGWFVQSVCDLLEQFTVDLLAGSRPRLMIQAPPRHGKSEIVSIRYLCWLLGNHPELSLISTGYGADLPERNSRLAQQLIASDRYRELWPVHHLGSARADLWGMEGHRGVVRAAGIGGGITGYGADVLILDDWCKDAQEAASSALQLRNEEWWYRVAYPRLSPSGGVIIIGTPWDEGDLAAVILRRSEETQDTPWTVVRYPAEAEEDEPQRLKGEALQPERYPLTVLRDIRSNIGERAYLTLYQLRPQPCAGMAVFEQEILAAYEAAALPPQRGELIPYGAPAEHKYEFQASPEGMARLWELPLPGYDYVASADFGGLGEVGVEVGRHDYHAFGVLRRGMADEVKQQYRLDPLLSLGRRDRPCVVMTWHGYMDLYSFAQLIESYLRFYNCAHFLGERNGAGQAVLDQLMAIYPRNLLLREQSLAKNRLSYGTHYGYYTTSANKPALIDGLKRAYRQRLWDDFDAETLAELKHFVNVDGVLRAGSQWHDDRVMQRALLWYAHALIPLQAPKNLGPPPPEFSSHRHPLRPRPVNPITGY